MRSISESQALEIVVIGGGAAGFFAAITCAESWPGCSLTILEKTDQVLQKVRLSGGGRCNLSNACFEPRKLAENYPRGSKELIGPFSRFQPRDTMTWFEERGVPLCQEAEGRLFPAKGRSAAIIDALTAAAESAGVKLSTGIDITSISSKSPRRFRLETRTEEPIDCDRLLLATGSAPAGHAWAKALGHSILPPVPSLFTFAITDERLTGLSGLSVEGAQLQLKGSKLKQRGAILITHHGLSGPAVLSLSSREARTLHKLDYQAQLQIDWLTLSREKIEQTLKSSKRNKPRLVVSAYCPFELPRRLWVRLLKASGIPHQQRWADLSNKQSKLLTSELTDGSYQVQGINPNKQEFVTCGGVQLKEVDFRTMGSRQHPGLYFAGEILDIDGITGGFNFQNAWTTGWLAGRNMGKEESPG